MCEVRIREYSSTGEDWLVEWEENVAASIARRGLLGAFFTRCLGEAGKKAPPEMERGESSVLELEDGGSR